MFCAYCGEDHDEGVAFTDEHVVPYAIGGSNAFTIRVCQPSNNRLGGLVDKPFIETFIVRSKRFFLGLSGTDGTEPTLDLSGKKHINGGQVDVTYRIGKGNSKLLKIASPTVTKTPAADGERWSVSGDPADVHRILKGKLESMIAQGKRMKDPDGRVLGPDDLEALLAASDVKTLNPGILMTHHFDWLVFIRFFAKLALATGHYVLGEPFSGSAHAEVLRKAIHAKDAREVSIQGAYIWPNIEAAQSVLALFRKEDSHLLGMLPIEPPVFFASLLGEISAIIPLCEPEKAKISSAPFCGRIFQIALPSRKFQDQTLDQYLSVLLAERRGKIG